MKKDDFASLKDKSLSHSFIKLGRLINTEGLNLARKKFKLPKLKQVHLDLFPYIDFEGTTISEIAHRKEVSKQAVSKLVNEMVQMKLLSIRAHTEDSRSKLVFFNTSGKFAIQNGFKALMDIDKKIIEEIGEGSYRSTLKKIEHIQKIFELLGN